MMTMMSQLTAASVVDSKNKKKEETPFDDPISREAEEEAGGEFVDREVEVEAWQDGEYGIHAEDRA